VIVVEVMGRMPLDRLCLRRGRRGARDPGSREDRHHHVCALLKYNYDHGKHYGVVVVAEGCHLPKSAR